MAEKIRLKPVSKTRTGFTAPLRYPAFVVLWLSEALSLIGDRLIIVALLTLIYERTQSPGIVGVVMLLKALPPLVLGSLAGVFVDRWNRKWVMVASNLIQGLLVLLFPLSDTLPLLFLAFLAMAVVNQFFTPARAATIPGLVPASALLAANSLFSAAIVGAMALGPALGGWITESFGANAAFYVDAITFLIPALAVAMLTIPQTSRPPVKRAVKADLSEGLAFIRTRADMLAALSLTSAAFMIMGTVGVLGVVVARESLNVGAGGFGLMMSGMGIGMLIGAVGVSRLAARLNRTRLSTIGVGLAGMAVAALPWMTQLYPALGLMVLAGLGATITQVSTQTTLQSAPEKLRGRVMGVMQMVMGGAMFLAPALAGLLAESAGTKIVLSGVGLIALSISIVVAIRFRNPPSELA
ncbi:MAG: MFS transporter [Opitutaceae bacterium]